jgi:hypothetical protein
VLKSSLLRWRWIGFLNINFMQTLLNIGMSLTTILLCRTNSSVHSGWISASSNPCSSYSWQCSSSSEPSLSYRMKMKSWFYFCWFIIRFLPVTIAINFSSGDFSIPIISLGSLVSDSSRGIGISFSFRKFLLLYTSIQSLLVTNIYSILAISIAFAPSIFFEEVQTLKLWRNFLW